MNRLYLGDSPDIVKRFFCGVLRDLGYAVYIDPMFTGAWNGEDAAFGKFLGATHILHRDPAQRRTALLIDPDTGVRDTPTSAHVSFDHLAGVAGEHELVLVLDQSFSRTTSPREQMLLKLDAMAQRNCQGFYYDSHARFLFLGREQVPLAALANQLADLGLPRSRLVHRPV